MTARDEILARIRTALATTATGAINTGGADAGTTGPVPRRYRTSGGLGVDELLDLLTDRLLDYRAEVSRCCDDHLAATVTALLARRGVEHLVVPARPPVELAGWRGRVQPDDPQDPVPLAQLDAADGVLTGCALAVAETGTIVLDAGPDQGRRALSLVPDYHLIVVRAEQVVHTVPEAVRRLSAARPLTWVSGPSATSDIELCRVEGVHGPRTLDVVLVTAG